MRKRQEEWRRSGGSLEIRWCVYIRLGVVYIYKASGFEIGAFGPSDFNRTVRKNRLGSPNKKTVTFCRCLGMIRTQR